MNTTKTENGITFTDNGDGSVTVSGVASAETYFVCHVHVHENLLRLQKQIYEGNGCPNGGSLNTFFVRFYYVDQLGNGVYFDNIGNGTSIIDLRGITDYFHEDTIRVGILIYVKANTNLSTPITFKPMIRPAGTDPTYVPYAMTNRELTKKVSVLDIINYDTPEMQSREDFIKTIAGQFIARGDGIYIMYGLKNSAWYYQAIGQVYSNIVSYTLFNPEWVGYYTGDDTTIVQFYTVDMSSTTP